MSDLSDEFDRHGPVADEFYVEPWTVTRGRRSLTVANLTPPHQHYLSALAVSAIGIGLGGGTCWYFGWQGRLGKFGWPAVAIGAFSGILLVLKSIGLVVKGLHGPIVYVFDAMTETATLDGRPVASWSDLAVEIEKRFVHTDPPVPANDSRRHDYEVRLRRGDDVYSLGVFAAEASAERLAVAISDYARAPLKRI